MQNSRQHHFSDANSLAAALAVEFLHDASERLRAQPFVTVALAGGRTPQVLYKQWRGLPADYWKRIHIFWSDERCVPPQDDASNFKMVEESFLEPLQIAGGTVHRMRGECEPSEEARRYQQEILNIVPVDAAGLPQFDWILLGVGTDGHTASLFPNSSAVQERKALCLATTHPESGQRRLTLTLPVLNNAHRTALIATGEEKAGILRTLSTLSSPSALYPVSMVIPIHGIVEWWVDEACNPQAT
ncbi:MAG: 6-phosphogluconolactonase [Ignavibacteriales bacterium]|nr:6-phosphogluconolactonase [Ignavibacteriales bacterium]